MASKVMREDFPLSYELDEYPNPQRKLDAICCPKKDSDGRGHWHILFPMDAVTITRLQILGDDVDAHQIHHIAADWAVTDATPDEVVAAIFGVIRA